MEKARPSPSTHYGICPDPTLQINNTSSTRSDLHLGNRTHLSPKDLAPSGSGTKSIPDPPSKFSEKKRGSDQTNQLHSDQPLKKPRTTSDSSLVKLDIMEIIPSMWEVIKCLWDPLECQINYIRKFHKIFEKLNEEAQELYDRKADVDKKIKIDIVSKMPTNECKAWLKKVDETEREVNGIKVEFRENRKFLGEWCPNIWWRMKLGKRMKTMIDDIVTLKEKSKFVGGVLVIAPPRIVEPIPTIIIEANTSTGLTVQGILNCLRDENVGKIGVWGMGGVGKTTALKNLNASPEIIRMFHIVIWVTVSNDWSVRRVQKDIANRLSLKSEDNESDDVVSRKIFQKLGKMKYLLLLDDVWNTVDLEAIGVPHPTRENDCKIVLTS